MILAKLNRDVENYVPIKIASWEDEGQAYMELLFVYFPKAVKLDMSSELFWCNFEFHIGHAAIVFIEKNSVYKQFGKNYQFYTFLSFNIYALRQFKLPFKSSFLNSRRFL